MFISLVGLLISVVGTRLVISASVVMWAAVVVTGEVVFVVGSVLLDRSSSPGSTDQKSTAIKRHDLSNHNHRYKTIS